MVRGVHVQMLPFMQRTKTMHKNLVKISRVTNSKCMLTPTNLFLVMCWACMQIQESMKGGAQKLTPLHNGVLALPITRTRIMLEHLSGGASMKRRGKRRREKRRGEKEREKKKRRQKKRREKKKGGEKKRRRKKRDEKNICSTRNRTQDFPHGRSKFKLLAIPTGL